MRIAIHQFSSRDGDQENQTINRQYHSIFKLYTHYACEWTLNHRQLFTTDSESVAIVGKIEKLILLFVSQWNKAAIDLSISNNCAVQDVIKTYNMIYKNINNYFYLLLVALKCFVVQWNKTKKCWRVI